MPSIGHVAVGLAVARAIGPPARMSPWVWAALLVAVSAAPDLDVVAFRLGIPYGAPFGHRGASHSIAFAALSGLTLGIAAWRLKLSPARIAVTCAAVMATHGVLDAFTDGGRGVALLWHFASWRPIPVSPIGLAVLSRRGAAVMLHRMSALPSTVRGRIVAAVATGAGLTLEPAAFNRQGQ